MKRPANPTCNQEISPGSHNDRQDGEGPALTRDWAGGGSGGGLYQVGDSSTTGAHSAEGCVARSVQEGERLLAIRHLHLKGANMLHSTKGM